MTSKEILQKLEELTVWEIRRMMSERGWRSQVRFSDTGIRNKSGHEREFIIWFKKWTWQRVKGADVTIWHGATVNGDNLEQGMTDCRYAVALAAEACLRAEKEYTDRIAHKGQGKDADGLLNLIENTYIPRVMEIYYSDGIFVSDPEPIVIPEPAGTGDLFLDALLGPYTDRAIYYEDRLSDLGGEAVTFTTRTCYRAFNGIKVSFRPAEEVAPALDEQSVAAQVKRKADEMRELECSFAPGGSLHGSTENGIPEGYQTLHEAIIERREKTMKENVCGWLVRFFEETGKWDEDEAEAALETWRDTVENSRALAKKYEGLVFDEEWLKTFLGLSVAPEATSGM